MITQTTIRSAKCKDCKFLKTEYIGKIKINKCFNENSKYYNNQKTLNDLVCDNWVMFGIE